MSLLFTFESVEEWVTCHNLLHKTIMMYILPNYKWYITKKASSFQWCLQKNSMKSPSCSILMPWYAMAIQLRWNGLNLRLPILMGVKGIFHLVNLPNGGLMFFLCICMDELRYLDILILVVLLFSTISFPWLSWFVASSFIRCNATSHFLPLCFYSWIKSLHICLTYLIFHFLDPNSTYTQIQHLNFLDNDHKTYPCLQTIYKMFLALNVHCPIKP